MNIQETEAYLLYEYAVYPRRNIVVGPIRTQQIEPKVMDVLCVMMARRGEVLSRDELIATIWGSRIGGDERLTRAISQLRKAFDDDAKSPRFIETVPKRGYRLICPVAVEPAGPPSAENAVSTASKAGGDNYFVLGKKMTFAAAAVGVLILLFTVTQLI